MKRKLERFAEMSTFSNVIQPTLDEVLDKNYILKGKWNESFFKNENPIVLELGCGKGEYTVGLAKNYTNKNFIGVDIKGARMWKGAKECINHNLSNVCFIRTRIELINSFFAPNEIESIWVTFPDPQLKKEKKRLTSSRFLNIYNNFVQISGSIHLKTDNNDLFLYTLDIANYNNLDIISYTSDLYNSNGNEEAKLFQTFYESKYLNEGLKIKYVHFKLNNNKIVEKPE